jgi:hypothetical protein
MSDYYHHEPTCPNCGTKQTSLICTTDNPECVDVVFVCVSCEHKIRVHAHMDFDYIDESLPSCGRSHRHCGDRDEYNKCKAYFEVGHCVDAILPKEGK